MSRDPLAAAPAAHAAPAPVQARPDAAASVSVAERRRRFEELALPLTSLLYGAAYRMCGTTAKAEDLLQDTLLTAWKNFGRFESGTNFKAWVFQILVFTQKNLKRRAKFREQCAGEDASAVLPARESSDAVQIVGGKPLKADWDKLYPAMVEDEFKHALDKLDAELRDVLLLVSLGELSYQECATALEIPIGTVMSRLFRARKQLQAELHEYAKARRLT